MKRMKRIMTWFLAVSLLIIGLVSCTKTKEAQTDTGGTYAIDNENNFYTFFDEYDYSSEYRSFTQSHLTCYSKDGDELWEQTFENEIAQGEIYTTSFQQSLLFCVK